MSREFKFRAWDETHKEWVDYGFCLRFDANGDCQVLNAFAQPFADRTLIPVFFTGLLDKAGKEIYEGDIVTHAAIQRTGPVVYREDTACFAMEFEGGTTALSYALLSEKPWEVIGNIYEHPELLKKDDKA